MLKEVLGTLGEDGGRTEYFPGKIWEIMLRASFWSSFGCLLQWIRDGSHCELLSCLLRLIPPSQPSCQVWMYTHTFVTNRCYQNQLQWFAHPNTNSEYEGFLSERYMSKRFYGSEHFKN